MAARQSAAAVSMPGRLRCVLRAMNLLVSSAARAQLAGSEAAEFSRMLLAGPLSAHAVEAALAAPSEAAATSAQGAVRSCAAKLLAPGAHLALLAKCFFSFHLHTICWLAAECLQATPPLG